MKIRLFKTTVKGKPRWEFFLLHDAPTLTGTQKRIPRPFGYESRDAAMADIDLVRKGVNANTPIVLTDKE